MTATKPTFVPTYWAETFWRLNTASKPLPLLNLHTPVSAFMAGQSEGTRTRYYPKAVSASSESASESVAMCSECDEPASQCACCGDCDRAPGRCRCEDNTSEGSAQSEAESCRTAAEAQAEESGDGRGSVDILPLRGGTHWPARFKLVWSADPQGSCRDRSFSSSERALACKAAIEQYSGEGTFLGAGRHRAAWLVGGLVVKVALCDDGIQANTDEVRTSIEQPVPVPDTALLTDDAIAVIAEHAPRLDAREARAILRSDSNPFDGFWVDEDAFGPQLGRLANGTVVCYDFSNG